MMEQHGDEAGRQPGSSDTEELQRLRRQVAEMERRETERTRTERRRSRLFLQTVLDAFPGNVAVLDSEGRIVMVNDRWTEFGLAEGFDHACHTLGADYVEVCRQAQGPEREMAMQTAEGIQSILSGQRNLFEMEYPCFSPTTQWWFRLQANGFTYEQKRWVVVAHLNITERRRAEEALRLAEERLRLAMQAGGMGMWDWDLQTGVIHWSPEHESLFGLRPGQFDGRYETFLQCIHPEDRPSLVAQVEWARDHGATYQQEYRIIRPDGSIHWVRSQGEFYYDGKGQPVRMNGVVADATEHRRIQEALLEHHANLLAILENTEDAIASRDSTGALVFCNTAFAKLVKRQFHVDAKPGLRTIDHLPAEKQQYWGQVMERVLAGESFQKEMESDFGDGDLRAYELSFTPIRKRDEIIGTVEFTRDVTKQKHAQRQADQRHAEVLHMSRLSTLGEMASGIAHELNQPLAAILSYGDACLHLAQAQPQDLPRIVRNLTEIVTQGERAGLIIRRMRALAKARQSRFVSTDLNEAVRNALTLVRWELGQNAISLSLEMAESLPPVRVDPIQIEQVLLNLIRNAIDAMHCCEEELRRLTLRTMVVDDNRVRVEVGDMGTGLPVGREERVFEPFFTTKPDGLGIGLSISHSIIEAHRGTLKAVTNPEHGATFFFTLPAQPSSGSPQPQ